MQADQRYWLELPRFADDDSSQKAQWQDAVLERMKIAWQGAMNDQDQAVLREAIANGLRRILPEDVVTVQYWPNASIANAIVHVTAAEFVQDDDRNVVPLIDMPYATRPITEVFEAEHLGAGIEARYLTPVEGEPGLLLGGVNYLFANDFGFIAVGMEPTLPALLGVAIESLRELVRSIRVIDDPDNAWQRCAADLSGVLSRGEQWPDTLVQGTTTIEEKM
jgi:hypothetical protein